MTAPQVPTTDYVISDSVPFLMCGLTRTLERVWPILDIYDVSQPDPKMNNVNVRLTREIVERILDFVILGHLKNKEFGEAFLMILVDKGTMRRWYREWVNPAVGKLTDSVKNKVKCMGRMFYLLTVVHDCAWDRMVLGHEGDEDLMYKADFPVITIDHPYGFSVAGAIKPHHLVAAQYNDNPRGAFATVADSSYCVYFSVIAFPGSQITFNDFVNKPTIAWTGTRVCDVMALDATCEGGIYNARKVLQPVVVLRLDTSVGSASEEWVNARWQWERFADLVYIAYEKAVLYIMDINGKCIKVK